MKQLVMATLNWCKSIMRKKNSNEKICIQNWKMKKKGEKLRSPDKGLEPLALRLKVWCSTDWANRAAHTSLCKKLHSIYNLYSLAQQNGGRIALSICIFGNLLTVVSCPDRFFLCFGWGKGSGVTPIAVSFWIPRFWGLFEGQWTSREQDVFMFQSPAAADSELWANTEPGARNKKTIDFIVGGLFSALQTIPRIWGFRTKRLLELHQTLFPHSKHRKKRSGHETIYKVPGVLTIYEGFAHNLHSENEKQWCQTTHFTSHSLM